MDILINLINDYPSATDAEILAKANWKLIPAADISDYILRNSLMYYLKAGATNPDLPLEVKVGLETLLLAINTGKNIDMADPAYQMLASALIPQLVAKGVVSETAAGNFYAMAQTPVQYTLDDVAAARAEIVRRATADGLLAKINRGVETANALIIAFRNGGDEPTAEQLTAAFAAALV